MNHLYKHIALALAVTSITPHKAHGDLWDDHFRLFEEQVNKMNKIMDSIEFPEQDQTQSPSIEISEDESTHGTIITIENVIIPALTATIKDSENSLLIETPTTAIQLRGEKTKSPHHALSVTIRQDNEITRDIDGNKSHSYSSHAFSQMLRLKAPIQFSGDTTKIDYNEPDKKLSIHVAHQQLNETRTQVPINVIQGTQKTTPEPRCEK